MIGPQSITQTERLEQADNVGRENRKSHTEINTRERHIQPTV